MRILLMLATYILPSFTLLAQTIDYNTYPVYEGNDLGLTYTPTNSKFRIWSPPADNAQLLIYSTGTYGEPDSIIQMQKSDGGTWVANLPGDNNEKFYAFRVHINNSWSEPVPDPYAKATGVNGTRAMIVDLNETSPPGWNTDQSPTFINKTDAIIYELHVRDASISSNSGIKNKGKFLGLTEKGTKNKQGLSTGLDHIVELGVTHVHLLPVFDFLSVNETKLNMPQYNWGYEPMNFNVPEGSYSTEPFNGATRITEFKQMVKAFHDNGLRVVMDVVYNHTMRTEDSYFNQLVPGYYYRQTQDGKFSNATACGNEMASERAMMRKFMLESMKYWVEEYHIDGFRVDLMGVHDIETMNIISKELHRIKPDILIYGEGWTAGSSPLPDSVRALKANASLLDRIAVFSDDMRDGIKGSVFVNEEAGFASGRKGMEESVKFGIVASCEHSQVDYNKVNYSKKPYSTHPYQTVNYAECHDNHVLWDKLKLSAKTRTAGERKEMYKLALSIVLTSQGISFLHAGGEFIRTKNGNENSYNAGDSVNAIDWDLKSANNDVYNYIRALVKMRKDQPIFRLMNGEELENKIRFIEELPEGMIAYTIKDKDAKGTWKSVCIILNGNEKNRSMKLPAGNWNSFVVGNKLTETRKVDGKINVKPFSCTILFNTL
jgi:pullulanase